MAGSKFQQNLKKQKESQRSEVTQPQVAASIASRTAPAPVGDAGSHQLLNQIVRPEMQPAGQIIRVPIDEVYAVEQVRPEEDFDDETIDGMVGSYEDFGNLTPPRCFPRDKRGYRLWFGETRVRSMRRRGDKFVDIYVGVPPKDEKQRILGQLIENLQQSGLKPLATAIAFETLKTEFGMTGEMIARSLGKPTTFVSKHMRIGNAPEKIKALLKTKKLSDVDLIYSLIQVNEINEDSANQLIDMVNAGKPLSRAAVIKELNRVKGRDPKTPSSKIRAPINISHAKSDGEISKSNPDVFVTDGEGHSHDAPVPLNSSPLPDRPQDTGPAREVRLSLVVMIDGMEGIVILDKEPEEFGWLWVRTKAGEIYIEASEVMLLGMRAAK